MRQLATEPGTTEKGRRPTVCVDCRYIGNGPSGIAEVVRELVNRIPYIAPHMHFLLLKNASHRHKLSAAQNVTEQAVRAGANTPATMWMLPEFADLSGVDLFHATFNIMPARLNMPVLTTIHDIMWVTVPSLCDRSTFAKAKAAFFGHGIRRALRHSDRIATVSEATRDAIAGYAPDAEERTVVTRSGVSDRFRPIAAKPELLRKLGLDPEHRYILTVGQFAPYKNHEGALLAFAKALGDRTDARMIFVQRQGHGTQALSELAHHLGVADKVTFLGQVSEEELVQLYSNAAALLHPSLCEGFGNPIAEAMACGCPVITSNRSAMPEVTNGAALYVDPTDIGSIQAALTTIWMDDEKSSELGKAGIARASQLNWDDFAEANVAIYREILGIS